MATQPVHVAVGDFGIASFINNLEDYYTTLLGQLIKTGTFSGTTSTIGELVVTHGWAFTPVNVIVTATVDAGGAIPYQIGGVISMNATTFTVRLGGSPGVPYTAATAVTVRATGFGA